MMKRSIPRILSRALAAVVWVGCLSSEVSAALNVHDSLNRYFLFGRRGVDIDYRATTAAGGWVGSDVVVTVDGYDTIRSVVTAGNRVVFENNNSEIWDRVRTNGNLFLPDGNRLRGSVYVGGEVRTTNKDNRFEDSLYIGGGHFRQPSWGVYYFGPAPGTLSPNLGVADVTPTTIPIMSDRIVWNMPPKAMVTTGIALPDTAFLTASDVSAQPRNVVTNFSTPPSGGVGRWTCGSNQAAGGSDLAGFCNAADTILPPGRYGTLDIWYGTTIYLTEGAYSFDRIILRNSSTPTNPTRLLAVQPRGLRTVIMTRNGLDAAPSGARNIIAPEKYQLGYGTDSLHFAGGTMMIYSEKSVVLDVNTEVWASVVVPKPSTYVEVHDRVHLFGQILADSIHIKNDFKGTDGVFIPYYPNKPVIRVFNLGAPTQEGNEGQSTRMNLAFDLDHIAGEVIRIWWRLVLPTRDTTVLGVRYTPIDTGAQGDIVNFIAGQLVGRSDVQPGALSSDPFTAIVRGNNFDQPNRYAMLVVDSVRGGTLDSSRMWNGKVAMFAGILDDDPLPTFRIRDTSVSEGTGPGYTLMKFVVQVVDSTTGAPLRAQDVRNAELFWSTVARTADSTDYVSVKKARIPFHLKSIDTITVQVRMDSLYEGNETFLVRVDSMVRLQKTSSRVRDTAVGTILDEDPAPTLTISDAPAAPEGDSAWFTVALSKRSALPTCFDWNSFDSTALRGTDFARDSGLNVCIGAGALSTRVFVRTLRDSIFEPTENFVVRVTTKTGVASTGNDLVAVGSIVNTNPHPRLVVRDTSVVRSSSATVSMKFVVTLLDSASGTVQKPSGVATTYDWTTVSGTAQADTDFVVASGSRSIPAGRATDTLVVSVKPDSRYSPPLAFTVQLSKTASIATGVSRLAATGTILSQFGRPRVVLLPDSVQEGDSSRRAFPMTAALRDSASGNPIASRVATGFTWTLSDSTARAGVDYVAASASGSVPAGNKTWEFVADSVIGNLQRQPDRLIKVALQTSDPNAQTGLSAALGTILDDDPEPLLSVDSVVAARDSVSGSRKPMYFHVRLIDPRTGKSTTSGLPISFRWKTSDVTAKGGIDYVSDVATLVLRAGVARDSFPVMSIGDDRYVVPLTFRVTLDSLRGARGGDTVGLGTILSGTRKPRLVVSGGTVKRSQVVGEIRPLPFQFYLADPVTGQRMASRVPVLFRWNTFDSSARSGRDFIGVDSASDTLPAGSKVDSLAVSTLGIAAYAPPRRAGVRIQPLDTTWLRSDASGWKTTGLITDENEIYTSFASRDTVVREDLGTPVPVVVRLTRSSSVPTTIAVRVDSSLTTALLGRTFRMSDSLARFAALDTLDTLWLTPMRDSIFSDTLQVRLKLLPNDTHNIQLIDPSKLTIRIVNVDPPPVVRFRDSLVVVREKDTLIRVMLDLDRLSMIDIVGTVKTIGGSAILGKHYRLQGDFTFPAMSRTTAVEVTILHDGRYGPDQDVVLSWGSFRDTRVVSTDNARDRERILIRQGDARPRMAFARDTLIVQDVSGGADLPIVLDPVSDSVALADLVLDSKRGLAKGVLMVPDSAYGVRIDTGRTSATFRVLLQNDGKVGPDRVVHLVLRHPLGADLGADSVLTLIIRNTNVPPNVKIVIPVDSARTNQAIQRVEWTVDGKAQKPTDTLLVNGWNRIARCFTDTAGNTGCDTHTVWADLVAPVVHVFKITGKNPHAPSKDTTWWGDRARTRFGEDTVWYWVRDSSLSSDGKRWTVKVDTLFKVTNFKGDGLFAVPVEAHDDLGNYGYDTGWIDLKQSIPVVEILNPPNGANVVTGRIPVTHQISDAGKSWVVGSTKNIPRPGSDTIRRCYEDDVGNVGCDVHRVVVQPVQVVQSYYVDRNGDGKVDGLVVELDSPWGTDLPRFDMAFGDSSRTSQKPDSANPYYAGPSRGKLTVVGRDTFWVVAGAFLTDSAGRPLKDLSGYPLTNVLGDSVMGTDGRPLRDSLGRLLFQVARPGKLDSTRFLVPIKPPFAFGMTGFDSLQLGVMRSQWKVGTGDSLRTFLDTFKIGERVPPVIVSAVVHRVENYKDWDTLVIKPSEKTDFSAQKYWLEILQCPGTQASCDTSRRVWVKVPADSLHKLEDGSFWFLVPPGDTGSVRPDLRVRFKTGIVDDRGNRVDTASQHWSTPVVGAPRPFLVQTTAPSRIPQIPQTEANRVAKSEILIKATRGRRSTDGSAKGMDWWEPGTGYVTNSQTVRDACPQDDYCNGPTLYINRPARMILYIYDNVGTFVTSRDITISQADLDGMERDQIDRISIQLEWNHRAYTGKAVASGVYLWRIVAYVKQDGSPMPVMTNQLVKVGVQVASPSDLF
ncbi:MAG: hypothetical protein IPO40_19130 [Fibrobacteres bacterium]|nr:hypothetical protein [Fibrobacterota bacterium]